MAFRPRNDDHAIVEVAFALLLSQNIPPHIIRQIGDRADEWTGDLPIVAETKSAGAFVDNEGKNLRFSELEGITGVLFKSVQRDASLDWQTRFLDNVISVNCGNYTRWKNVWPTARRFLDRGVQHLTDFSTNLSSFALQYVDEFVWDGAVEDYDIKELFGEQVDILPSMLQSSGPLWHYHLGWFEDTDLAQPGRRLHRLHIDAVEQQGEYVVRIDTVIRYDIAQLNLEAVHAFDKVDDDQPKVDIVFDDMHERSKNLLRSAVSDGLAARIKLNDA